MAECLRTANVTHLDDQRLAVHDSLNLHHGFNVGGAIQKRPTGTDLTSINTPNKQKYSDHTAPTVVASILANVGDGVPAVYAQQTCLSKDHCQHRASLCVWELDRS